MKCNDIRGEGREGKEGEWGWQTGRLLTQGVIKEKRKSKIITHFDVVPLKIELFDHVSKF